MSTDTQDTMSRETHDALLERAIREATSTTEAALERKIEELSAATKRADEAEAKAGELEADNARLNGELDKAQIDLKAATDKAAALESEKTEAEKAAAKAEVANERAQAVKTLGLFSEEYVQERASRWAELADDAWAEQLAEWRLIKPAEQAQEGAGSGSASQDAASAMTGSTESLTKDGTDSASTVSPRRRALGLV